MDTDLNLTEVAQRFNCDKWSHNYMPFYKKHLPNHCERLLEVGCEMGESLRMWRELYPTAEIHTIDLFQNPLFASERDMKNEGFITYPGDQFYKSTYQNLEGKFDVIIEDGSHRADHQLFTFENLFEKFVKPEGLYVAEDLHCNQDKFFWGTVGQFEDTMLASLERKGSWFYALYGQMIQSVNIYDRKIAFIRKRLC